jgi:hypothetical protein
MIEKEKFKMKKFIICFLVIILIIPTISACASNNINITEASATILENVTFEEELESLERPMADKLLGTEDFENVYMYTGSRAVADLLVIIEADASMTAKAKESVEKYVQKQNASYKDYKPSELDKIENAVISVKGNCVILCITNDYDNAFEIINNIEK